MSGNDSTTQHTPNSTFYVSSIDISLAEGSRKTIRSIRLSKNDESLKEIQKTMCAGVTHREEFNALVAVKPDDHISVSVNCCSRMWKQMDIPVDINLQDTKFMREEQGGRSYRKKFRKVEVVVTCYDSSTQLLATTKSIIESCSQFRLLIIGNSGVGKTSLICKVFGVEGVHVSETSRGAAKIDQEFVSPTNERFVVHDSLGFEAGDEENMEKVKKFVAERKAMSQLKDQLHAIWLCLETPYSGGRLLEGGVETFLKRRNEILGDIPLVVVLTKVDQLDGWLELDPPEGETPEEFKSRYLDEHCIRPLHQAAGSDITHVAISVQDGYADSVANLFRATDENMAKYHVSDASRVVASIAQRVSIKEKIESSIAVGKKKYWNMLLKSAVFRGHTLEECMQVIREDIITIWNFDDPDMCLMDDKIIGDLLRLDNLGGNSGAASATASFADVLISAFEALKGPTTSGDITLALAAHTATMALSLLKVVYEVYQEAKRDVKIFMSFIVDLVCVMQIIFLVTSGRRVTPHMVDLALKAYETPRKCVHLMVDAFDWKRGVLPGGRDHALEEIEALIWRYSIADHEVEKLRQTIGKVLASSSS